MQRHGGVLVKRDDLFSAHGVSGGKVRTCLYLATRAQQAGAVGLVTAGARQSPQVEIVATLAAAMGLQCRAHVPWATLPSPQVDAARAAGATVVEHRPGYNSVIIARSLDDWRQLTYPDAMRTSWRYIPFGMECQEAVERTASQVASLPWGEFDRIVVPVGSGMSLAGILHGLHLAKRTCPLLGVVVGADPSSRLDRWAREWRHRGVELAPAGMARHIPYQQHVEASLGELQLDPVYEAKCVEFLVPGDLLWVVGRRGLAAPL